MILPQVHPRKPCYDFSFLQVMRFTELFLQSWTNQSPNYSPNNSIGRSDGRCVQRAGTWSARAHDLRLLGIPRWRFIIAIYSHHDAHCRLPNLFRQGYELVECISVAHVRPRTSEGITDLLCLKLPCVRHTKSLQEVIKQDSHLTQFTRLRSRSLTESTRQITPPTKNGHAPPPLKEPSLGDPCLCLELVRFPVLSQIKPQAPIPGGRDVHEIQTTKSPPEATPRSEVPHWMGTGWPSPRSTSALRLRAKLLAAPDLQDWRPTPPWLWLLSLLLAPHVS